MSEMGLAAVARGCQAHLQVAEGLWLCGGLGASRAGPKPNENTSTGKELGLQNQWLPSRSLPM